MEAETLVYKLTRFYDFKRSLKHADWLYTQGLGLTEFFTSEELKELGNKMEELISNRINKYEKELLVKNCYKIWIFRNFLLYFGVELN